jgi:hypothetical protein
MVAFGKAAARSLEEYVKYLRWRLVQRTSHRRLGSIIDRHRGFLLAVVGSHSHGNGSGSSCSDGVMQSA